MNTKVNDKCSVMSDELKNNSALIIHKISLCEAAWLREIQR